MNTGVLLRRIAEVKHEFAAIVKEVEAIKDAEKASDTDAILFVKIQH